jgi:hypothetical protein
MSRLRPNRSLAGAGVLTCRSQEHGADNNRGGQDKSGGPVGAYAVVVVGFSDDFAQGLGAVSGLTPLRRLAFPGTNTVSPIR